MASISYILMGQAYIDTVTAVGEAWSKDHPPCIKHAKLSEVRALLPEPELERVFQLTLTEAEGYILGTAYCLAHAVVKGDVDAQGFFIQASVMFMEKEPNAYGSLASKMMELAKAL